MSALAPTMEAFFTERLMTQRQASPRTIAAYRDTLRMLLTFTYARTGKAPSQLDVADVDAKLIGAFLTHLEADRHNSARTRNTRLAAIHSLFRYAALHHPEHAQVIQRVLAIPSKRHDRTDVSFLQPEEVDALLAMPDRATWIGRRDHALLVLMVQTGLRVSELTGLTCADLVLATGAHVRCTGKGRKERATPLTAHTVALLAGVDERAQRFPSGSALPDVPWRPAQHRRRAVARHQVCSHGSERLPVDGSEDHLTSYPSPHLCHEPPPQRRRRCRDRFVAGP